MLHTIGTAKVILLKLPRCAPSRDKSSTAAFYCAEMGGKQTLLANNYYAKRCAFLKKEKKGGTSASW